MFAGTVPDGVVRVALGHVFPGEPVTFPCRLSNRSGNLWRITEMRTGCRCTIADAPNAIAPGETAAIDITYTPGRTEGRDQRVLEVTIDDGAPRSFVVAFSADVHGPVSCQPQRLTASLAALAESTEVVLKIGNYSDGPWSSLHADSKTPWVKCGVAERLQDADADNTPPLPREVWTLPVTLSRPSAGEGLFLGAIQITAESVSGSLLDPIETTVELTVRSPVRALPPILATLFTDDRPSQRDVFLIVDASFATAETTATLKSVPFDEAVTATLHSDGPRRWTLKTVWDPTRFEHASDKTTGILTGEFIVAFTANTEYLLTIPVRVSRSMSRTHTP
jgi:hypothetical protein